VPKISILGELGIIGSKPIQKVITNRFFRLVNGGLTRPGQTINRSHLIKLTILNHLLEKTSLTDLEIDLKLVTCLKQQQVPQGKDRQVLATGLD